MRSETQEGEPEISPVDCFGPGEPSSGVPPARRLGRLAARKRVRGKPRLTNLKTRVGVLINFAYESVKYFNFLGSGAVRIFNGFVYDYFLDERIEHFGSQLCGLGVLLD